MKKNNKNTIITVITASLLLLTTGCSQAAETVDIIATDPTFESSVTTINTEAVTTAQTTAQITTAAQTTVITTIPVTEAPPVTVQTEAAPVPVSTTTTKAAPAATKTTTTTTTPKPKEPAQEDRSYLNLTPAEVQYILDECQKYAKSLGYKVESYIDYKNECDELNKKCRQLRREGVSEEEIDKIWDEFEGTLRCFTDVTTEEFWSGNWHYIMYAGNFTKAEEDVYQLYGYDRHCSTKEESIQWVIKYLKYWIDEEISYCGGRSISVTGTKLRTFDNYGRENDGVWGMVSYEDIHREYASFDVYDLDTSYAFSVKYMQ